MRLRLHLDADASRKSLHEALTSRGHDVTRTPSAWISFDDPDHVQLASATAHKRAIFTFNIRDFASLAREQTQHYGIVFAQQRQWSLSQLIAALDKMLTEVAADELRGQVVWLNRWAS